MEEHTSEDIVALLQQMHVRLHQLESLECHFCREDFFVLLDALSTFNREAILRIGTTH